jgi:glutaredoxin
MEIKMYSATWCGYCVQAKALLKRLNLPFEEINLGDNLDRDALEALTGGTTVPQIIIDNQPIGGYTELAIWAKQNATLLAARSK